MKPLKVCLSGALVLPLLLLSLEVAGCANPDAPDAHVMILGNQDVTALDADDVVRIMRQAAFSDQQIIDLGTDLRNALAAGGAAQIRVGKMVEAIFAVDGPYLGVSSRRRGSFIYDPRTGRFR
jgi:hypothetical protein